ncbi:MAG: hypothetical protein B7Z07_01200 [Sphingomonadales bacterium 32-67-7]|nr:MAG: hypothetical protein B7Z07_01200 [Sphingomonadales bacterium 32-67-7]
MFAAIMIRGSRDSPQDHASGEDLLGALTPYAPADVSGIWQNDRALIAQARHHNTPESLHEKAPEVCRETGRVIASWVRLDNRTALCAALGLEPRPGLTDPQIIPAAPRQWGADCAARLEGDFSFVIYDPVRDEAYCARDAIGAKPFYYFVTESLLVAATSVAAIRAVKGLNLTPDLQWTALFAVRINLADRQSAYTEVKKLPAAHDLMVRVEGAPAPREYFQFDLVASHATEREQKWVDAYRAAFDDAVDARARTAFLIGAESSAGLDSSSVVATLVDRLPHARDDFHCFGMAMFEDEPELLLATAAMHDIRHTHILLRPRIAPTGDSFTRALKAIGHPPEHEQMLQVQPFLEQCRSLGIRSLLSGYGGDEVVTSFARTLTTELWHRHAYGAVFDELPGSPVRRLAEFGKLLLKGPPDPRATRDHGMTQLLEQGCLNQEFLRDSGLLEQVQRWLTPEHPDNTLNVLAASGAGFRHGRAARLESEANYAATFGIEYRYPMFDRALIQQFFATPSIEKRRRDMGRYLHRRAMQGRLPDRILWQKTKWMGQKLNGSTNLEPHQPVRFEELPSILQLILDRSFFEQAQKAQIDAPDEATQSAVRRALFFFHIRQIAEWARG